MASLCGFGGDEESQRESQRLLAYKVDDDVLRHYPGHKVLRLAPLGRKLAYTECGLPRGEAQRLLVCFHGIFGIGDFAAWNEDFQKRGWRVLAPTLPGWGLSDPVKNRRLADFPKDIEQLVNEVAGSEATFDVLGISFGGVHALACAALLPRRVTRLAILSGHAPFDDPEFDPFGEMPFSTSFFMYRLPSVLPSLARWGANGFRNKLLSDPADFSKSTIDGMSDAEKRQLESLGLEKRTEFAERLGKGAADSVRLGVYGLVPDSALILRSPWGFRLEDIECPAVIAGCKEDKLVPWAMQQYIHEKLTRGKSEHEVSKKYRLVCYPEGGHLTTTFMFPRVLEELHSLEPLSISAPVMNLSYGSLPRIPVPASPSSRPTSTKSTDAAGNASGSDGEMTAIDFH